jgi:hypothetical protein
MNYIIRAGIYILISTVFFFPFLGVLSRLIKIVLKLLADDGVKIAIVAFIASSLIFLALTFILWQDFSLGWGNLGGEISLFVWFLLDLRKWNKFVAARDARGDSQTSGGSGGISILK